MIIAQTVAQTLWIVLETILGLILDLAIITTIIIPLTLWGQSQLEYRWAEHCLGQSMWTSEHYALCKASSQFILFSLWDRVVMGFKIWVFAALVTFLYKTVPGKGLVFWAMIGFPLLQLAYAQFLYAATNTPSVLWIPTFWSAPGQLWDPVGWFEDPVDSFDSL